MGHTLLWDLFVFVFVFFQKPESIKAIMFGIPDRQGRGRMVRRCQRAFLEPGQWLCLAEGHTISRGLLLHLRQPERGRLGRKKANDTQL